MSDSSTSGRKHQKADCLIFVVEGTQCFPNPGERSHTVVDTTKIVGGPVIHSESRQGQPPRSIEVKTELKFDPEAEQIRQWLRRQDSIDEKFLEAVKEELQTAGIEPPEDRPLAFPETVTYRLYERFKEDIKVCLSKDVEETLAELDEEEKLDSSSPTSEGRDGTQTHIKILEVGAPHYVGTPPSPKSLRKLETLCISQT